MTMKNSFLKLKQNISHLDIFALSLSLSLSLYLFSQQITDPYFIEVLTHEQCDQMLE